MERKHSLKTHNGTLVATQGEDKNNNNNKIQENGDSNPQLAIELNEIINIYERNVNGHGLEGGEVGVAHAPQGGEAAIPVAEPVAPIIVLPKQPALPQSLTTPGNNINVNNAYETNGVGVDGEA